MKKISLFAVSVCAAAGLFAQEQTLRTKMESTTRFGIKAGVNVSDFRTESGFNGRNHSKTSYNAGVYVNVPFGTSGFAFQPEVQYSKQGASIAGGSTAANSYSYNQNLDYLSVPLIFQYKIPKGFFLEAGPQLGFLMDARIKEGTSLITNGRNKQPWDKFDLAATYGIGYMSRVGLGIGARYVMGLSDAISDDAPVAYTGKARNSVWQFGLTYAFGASK